MGGKRMPLSKDARKYRKMVEDLREEMAKMQETIDTIPALEAKLVELDETKGELQQVRATLESTEGRMAHLEKVHERDTKARTSASMKMKQAVKRADRLQRLNKDMSAKLQKANKEVDRLLKVGRENVVLQHEVEKAEFFKEQTRAKLAREEEEAKKERKFRLKELFTHEQTLEQLEEQKALTEKEKERTAEALAKVEEVKAELLKTQIELDQQAHTHEVRVTALHMQRDEIARLKDLITHLREDISVQRGEINMWSTRYKRLRDGFRVLQARLAKQIRATNANPTQSQKGELVSPPESSLLLLQAEMNAVIEADAHIRSKSDTHSSMLKRRALQYSGGVTAQTLRDEVRHARHIHSSHARLTQTAPQLMGKSTLPKRTRPPAEGSHLVHTPAPACERTELPAYQRAVLPDSKHQMSRSLTDSYVGVGPGTMAGGSTFTPEGYITAGDGGSSSMAAGGGMDTAAALDAVTGGSSSAKANFYDHKYLQDDAMVAAIMQSEREEVAKERRRRAAAARRKQRVGRPRPAGPPSDEAGANGSLFVGKGLGLRKGVAKHDNGGSVRQVLARILDDNPEVARLRKLEQSKLPF